MKALVEDSVKEKKPCKAGKRYPVTELSASQLRLLKAAFEGTHTEEPAGVLAGASFKFSS